MCRDASSSKQTAAGSCGRKHDLHGGIDKRRTLHIAWHSTGLVARLPDWVDRGVLGISCLAACRGREARSPSRVSGSRLSRGRMIGAGDPAVWKECRRRGKGRTQYKLRHGRGTAGASKEEDPESHGSDCPLRRTCEQRHTNRESHPQGRGSRAPCPSWLILRIYSEYQTQDCYPPKLRLGWLTQQL